MKKNILIPLTFLFILILSGCSKNQDDLKTKEESQRTTNQATEANQQKKDIISLFAQCGLKSITIPEKFGPYTLASELFDEQFGEERKRTEIGFLNASGQSSRIFIVCQHYDFSAGIEFDSFASREDYEKYPKGYTKDFIGNFGHNENAGVKKTAIFPRKDAYMAIVYEKFSDSASKDLEALKKGEDDTIDQSLWNSIDEIASSVTFEQ